MALMFLPYGEEEAGLLDTVLAVSARSGRHNRYPAPKPAAAGL
jgi:hypothetical protein